MFRVKTTQHYSLIYQNGSVRLRQNNSKIKKTSKIALFNQCNLVLSFFLICMLQLFCRNRMMKSRGTLFLRAFSNLMAFICKVFIDHQRDMSQNALPHFKFLYCSSSKAPYPALCQIAQNFLNTSIFCYLVFIEHTISFVCLT